MTWFKGNLAGRPVLTIQSSSRGSIRCSSLHIGAGARGYSRRDALVRTADNATETQDRGRGENRRRGETRAEEGEERCVAVGRLPGAEGRRARGPADAGAGARGAGRGRRRALRGARGAGPRPGAGAGAQGHGDGRADVDGRHGRVGAARRRAAHAGRRLLRRGHEVRAERGLQGPVLHAARAARVAEPRHGHARGPHGRGAPAPAAVRADDEPRAAHVPVAGLQGPLRGQGLGRLPSSSSTARRASATSSSSAASSGPARRRSRPRSPSRRTSSR